MTADLLEQARAGDRDAFAELVAPVGSLGGVGGFRRTIVGAHVALPDRDQPLPECAALREPSAR